VRVVEALAAIDPARTDLVLVDCLTLWLSNLLLADLGDEPILAEVDRLVASAAERRVSTVLVTNEVGMGVVPESALGRRFRDLTGFAHQRLAAAADEVYVAVLGCVLRVHPGPVERV
jgi:adenosylcobinamide kinase/adenosylcobinamide-phosphate guanylyltransferase